MSTENKHHEFDKAMSEAIRADLLSEGITSYPAECSDCKGKKVIHGIKCENCDGEGHYQLAV